MGTVLHLCQFPHQKQEQVPVGIIWNHDQRLLASWSNSTAQVHSLTPLKLPVLIWPEGGTGITQSVAAEIQFSTGPSWNVYFLQRSVLVVLTYLFPLLERARQITKTPQMSRTRNCPAVFSKFSDFYILPFYIPFFPLHFLSRDNKPTRSRSWDTLPEHLQQELLKSELSAELEMKKE